MKQLISELKESQTKSDLPHEYEKFIADSFKFLGFEAELIGGKGDTDVLLTANIGQESYKVTADGKTSKSGKISGAQIDWLSLEDHKVKNKAAYTVLVGPSFAEGNILKRSKAKEICLMETKDLIRLLEVHNQYPFTLLELRDLFVTGGPCETRIEDLITQNKARFTLIEQFQTVIDEMHTIQERLGYFTFDSLASREKMEELDISPEEIQHMIQLLQLPFINALKSLEDNRFIITVKRPALSVVFDQIAQLLGGKREKNEPKEFLVKSRETENQFGTRYYHWKIKGESIITTARKEKPYEHFCPMDHFREIGLKVVEAFTSNRVINRDTIFTLLIDQELTRGRIFKGKAEAYKIGMVLGVLELESIIKWTGTKRPIEYTLNVGMERLEEFLSKL